MNQLESNGLRNETNWKTRMQLEECCHIIHPDVNRRVQTGLSILALFA